MTYEELEQKYIQIPQEIKNTRRWVCYRTEVRDGAETKIPMNAITGGHASTADPSTWTSFKLALSGCVKYGFVGLGFMLGEDPNTGTTYFGVDLDNHIDKVTGKKPYETPEAFKEFAYIFINTLNSYTEYSHSGEGVHIICKGKLPGKRNKHQGVEMYDYRRFFTMTGKVINNVPIVDRTEEVKPLWEKYLNVVKEENEQKSFNYTQQKNIQYQAKINANGSVSFEEVEIINTPMASAMDDYELIEKIRNSQQGQDFMRLFNGDMSSYDNDHSRADMAMCKILAFWTGCNPQQMDRIFRQSALMRDKWERRWGDGTYGSHAIQDAIRTQGQVYSGPAKEQVIIPIKTDNNVPIQPQGDIIQFNERNDPLVKIKQIFKSYPLTDTGNAERFYDYFGEYFRYDAKAKSFMFWNGKNWAYDVKNYIKKYADMIIGILRKEIKDTEEKISELSSLDNDIPAQSKEDLSLEEYQSLVKAQRDNLKRVSNKAGKEAMISEFQHLHEIAVTTEEFDTQPYLLNTDSGVVDLLNNKILPYDKNLKLSKNTNCMVSYEEPKVFLKFLRDIFKRPNEVETQEIIDTVQLLLGDTISGRFNKDRLVIMYGDGSNGKSTFMNIIKKCLGEYGKQINPELLLQQKGSSMQSMEFSFATIKGARLLSMSELDDGERMSDKTVKKLTSGEEVAAQKKFGEQFEYRPTFSPWMSTNPLPIIRSKDYGIWRRIFLIPFLVKFTDENKDIHMPEKLEKEAPQILGWMIKGFYKLNNECKGIIKKPKCLEESLSDYKNNMDVINLYISSNCQNFPGYRTNADLLFQNYKKWALDNNEFLLSKHAFEMDMQKHGFSLKKDSVNGLVYIGIKLNTDHKGHNFALDFEELKEINNE